MDSGDMCTVEVKSTWLDRSLPISRWYPVTPPSISKWMVASYS